MGQYSRASSSHAIAIGDNAVAGNGNAVAIGSNLTAYGNSSMALGHYVRAHLGADGALIIGDKSTTTILSTNTSNRFTARFAGGYSFRTNSTGTTGAVLAANGGSWASISD